MKFRKKPVVIEAFKYGIDDIPDWFMNEVKKDNIQIYDDDLGKRCLIKTLEGKMAGGYSYYIIRGVNGEIYPCKPDIFEKTYEAVAETSE
ncbi:hypothetical protein [Shouchella hunanensis]|uniref:Phage protein n=1 Tax=Shouchella hunanensis TaxID=766894 RepID=A0ABY7W4Y0_9BACI|nr:hypothetical protein [Shouchella hunanensis]WDF02935.1 hypothetical protein PQ477_15725 [Shouchella hunanensis]